jgi:cellulose synthase operon protein C
MIFKLRPLLSVAGRVVLALLLIGSAQIVASQSKGNSEAREAYKNAREFVKKRDWRSAKIALLNATAADKGWAESHLLLAEVALELFDPVTAKAHIDKAAAAGANEIRYNHLLGHAHWLAGKLDDAEAILSKAPMQKKNLPYAYRILGRVQMDQGDTIAAAESFDEGLKLAPKDSRLWTEVGRLRIVIANLGGAAEALDRAVALDITNVRAIELRGRLVRTQFGLIAALPWFERGLQVDPNDLPLLEEYGATLGEVGRYRDMLAQARKIIQLDRKNARGFFMQATIAARSGNHALARRIMEKVSGRFAELPGPQILIAISDYELGNFNQAVDRLAPLVEAQPHNMRLRLLLARALHQSGDHAGAWDIIAPAAERSDADSYTLSLATRIQEALGERGNATGRMQQRVFASIRTPLPLRETQSMAAAADDAKRNPKDARKVIPYVRLLLANKDFAGARSAAKPLIDGNAGVYEAQMLSGDIEFAAGNRGAAVAAYERARGLSFSATVMARLVTAYRATGNMDAASRVIADYLGYNPSSPVAQQLRAYDMIDRQAWNDALPMLYRVRATSGFNDPILGANIARTLSALGRHDDAIREARLAYRIDPANFMTTHVYGKVLFDAKREPKTARDLLRKANKLAPDNAEIRRLYQAAEKAMLKSKKAKQSPV